MRPPRPLILVPHACRRARTPHSSHPTHPALPAPLLRVYPGKGRRFVTKSGQLVVLAGSKVRGLRQSGKKPAKLVWTQAWRRMHKKLNVEQAGRRRARKVVKTTVVRSTVGMDASLVRNGLFLRGLRAPPGCDAASRCARA